MSTQVWAQQLGVSEEACALVASSEVLDLHLDTFIWTRVFGYDLARRHGTGLFDARFYGHADIPRLVDGGVTSAIWSITTNPFRPAGSRRTTFLRNLARLKAILDAAPDTQHVRSLTEFNATRAAGRHAAWIGIQGGNAIDVNLDLIGSIPDDSVCRITLVHLTTSSLGRTSAPDPLHPGATGGLTDKGREFVERCDAARILVDLAHIHPDGFWDAVDVHDPSLPLIVTHTGVSGVTLHWRNLDDDQLHAIARSGGTVGIMFQCSFLGARGWGEPAADKLFAHIAHAVDVIGEDHVSIGTDWDGAITTPRDMKTALDLPVLVQQMLDAGWSDGRITKILGGNALRVLGTIRP